MDEIQTRADAEMHPETETGTGTRSQTGTSDPEMERPPDGSGPELAAGAGDTGYEVAKAIGGGGRLVSSDFFSEMLNVARRRAAKVGVENVAQRVIDAVCNDLEPDSVDGILCRFGYMLMADPGAARSR